LSATVGTDGNLLKSPSSSSGNSDIEGAKSSAGFDGFGV